MIGLLGMDLQSDNTMTRELFEWNPIPIKQSVLETTVENSKINNLADKKSVNLPRKKPTKTKVADTENEEDKNSKKVNKTTVIKINAADKSEGPARTGWWKR